MPDAPPCISSADGRTTATNAGHVYWPRLRWGYPWGLLLPRRWRIARRCLYCGRAER